MPQTLQLSLRLHRCRPGLLCAMALVGLLATGGCKPSDDGGAASTGEGAEASPAGTPRGEAAGPLEAQLWIDDVRIGHQVDPDGAIPIAQQGDEFAPGERVYVSMDVSDAPEYSAVHVVFEDAAGETVAEDEKKVPAEARRLYFDSGDTTHWQPGAYRVILAVDGEAVAEQELTLTGRPAAREGEPG